MRRWTNSKDMNDLIGRLTREGWTAAIGRNGHLKLTSPDERIKLTCSRTPKNDRNAARELARDLRRAGYPVS